MIVLLGVLAFAATHCGKDAAADAADAAPSFESEDLKILDQAAGVYQFEKVDVDYGFGWGGDVSPKVTVNHSANDADRKLIVKVEHEDQSVCTVWNKVRVDGRDGKLLKFASASKESAGAIVDAKEVFNIRFGIDKENEEQIVVTNFQMSIDNGEPWRTGVAAEGETAASFQAIYDSCNFGAEEAEAEEE